jgi:hypothetical protein
LAAITAIKGTLEEGSLMTADAAIADAPIPVAPTVLSTAERWKILAYMSALVVLLGFGAPNIGLIDIPIQFFLKNKFHLSAHALAGFRLWAAIPLYLSFVFGFARDRFNPFGMRDRGFMVLFGTATAVLYVVFAFTPITTITLLTGVIVLTCSYLFVLGAQNGLVSTIGQQHVMSGQISAVWNIVLVLPAIVGFALGGILSDQLEHRDANHAARILFLTGAAAMAAVALYGLWKPVSVYGNLHSERRPAVRLRADVARLVRYWPIYPALGVWLLWNFAPGAQTVLQYYLSNTLHASDSEWGYYNAIFAASFIPTFIIYGLLCQKVALRGLLWWGTLVGVPQMMPLIFVHSASAALIVAVPIGLMGGVASAAYIDLLIRSCPKGLQGTIMMMSAGLYFVSSRFGDLWGTSLYEHPWAWVARVNWGSMDSHFAICAIATTAVYALILPTLLLVPKRLIATADGEVAPAAAS